MKIQTNASLGWKLIKNMTVIFFLAVLQLQSRQISSAGMVLELIYWLNEQPLKRCKHIYKASDADKKTRALKINNRIEKKDTRSKRNTTHFSARKVTFGDHMMLIDSAACHLELALIFIMHITW